MALHWSISESVSTDEFDAVKDAMQKNITVLPHYRGKHWAGWMVTVSLSATRS